MYFEPLSVTFSSGILVLHMNKNKVGKGKTGKEWKKSLHFHIFVGESGVE